LCRSFLVAKASAVLMLFAVALQAAVVEDFNGWSDGAYGAVSSYNHSGVGMWESLNAVCDTLNSRSGNVIRFDDDTPAPYLEYQGLDGNGKDGGVGAISFWYRHWDGDANAVAFQVQFNPADAGWTNVGGTVNVTGTSYQLFNGVVDWQEDNVLIRVLSVTPQERLLIDDLQITDFSEGTLPTVSFEAGKISVGEEAGLVHVGVVLNGPADATVRAAQAGSAVPGAQQDYTLSSTSLVFSAAGPTIGHFEIFLNDDSLIEGTETIELMLAGLEGAQPGNPVSMVLSVADNDGGMGSPGVILIMSANLTSGTQSEYKGPGTRIFQALVPDIVAIQEFNVTNAGGRREFVDETFGPTFHFMVESGSESIPNGVISRWPIVASGEWNDPQVANRDFAWATIDIPGGTDLHLVSVHLHSSGGSSSRNIEAGILVNQVSLSFPPGDYIVLAGDLNTNSRTEAALLTLSSVFSDAHQPVDALGDDDTNEPRTSPYDYVLPNPALDSLHVPLSVHGETFVDGMVFDSRTWTTPPSPILTGDSGVSGMQHMAVMKAFAIPVPRPRISLSADLFNHRMDITVPTEPTLTYEVEYADELSPSPPAGSWFLFANPAAGRFTESNGVPGLHTFQDDFSTTTTSNESPGGSRVYRVRILDP
jgi:endonuclease/exonuclease/phosphatase family metal-dependent hydrolase